MTHHMQDLDVHQVAALIRWKAIRGRTWKRELLQAWETGRYGFAGEPDTCLLQQVRNKIGPSGLSRIRLD